MRRVRTAPTWAWVASAVALVALVVLAPVTAGWVEASSSAPREDGARPAVERADVRNADGTVGPVVALGDSLTADTAQPTSTGAASSRSWFTHALAEEPRLVGVANAGIPGDTTAGMAARFARDVTVHAPRVVVILGGTNDVPGGRTIQEVLGTLEQLADLARDAGATPVLATVPPRTDGRYAQRVADLNDAVRRSAADSGTPVLDFHSVLADDDGRWRAGFTVDGVHPTAAAAEAMGRLAAETLVGD